MLQLWHRSEMRSGISVSAHCVLVRPDRYRPEGSEPLVGKLAVQKAGRAADLTGSAPRVPGKGREKTKGTQTEARDGNEGQMSTLELGV